MSMAAHTLTTGYYCSTTITTHHVPDNLLLPIATVRGKTEAAAEKGSDRSRLSISQY